MQWWQVRYIDYGIDEYGNSKGEDYQRECFYEYVQAKTRDNAVDIAMPLLSAKSHSNGWNGIFTAHHPPPWVDVINLGNTGMKDKQEKYEQLSLF